MDSGKNLEKSLSSTDYNYTWVHVFFWVSELFASFAFFSVKRSIDLYNMEFYFIGRFVGELQPASMLFVCYVTDSFVGKYVMFHVTSVFTVVGSVVLLIAYCIEEFSSALGFCLMVFVVIGKGWHPLRYAIVYSQLAAPVNKIRRFVVVHVAAHALGEALAYLLDEFKLSRRVQLLWLLTQLITTTVAFYVTVVVLYKYRYLRLYFKENSTEKALVSIHRAVHEKNSVQEETQRKLISEDERKYAMGLLFVLLVLALCTIIHFDSFIVKFYLGEYRNFVPSSEVPRGLPMTFLFYLGGVLLVLTVEFVVIPTFARYKVYILYITMITMAFIMATAALLTLGVLSVKMGFAAPFPPPFEGEAHLTVFNCLPVMTEFEWPNGQVDAIPAYFYHRTLNIPVSGGREMELRDIGVFNTAYGLYELANLTIEANRENVFIVKNNGATRVNISSTMVHTREITGKGQVRILDCLENCCHGQIVFELHGRHYLTYDLTANYISEKMEMSRGLYQVFYSPNTHQKVHLGEMNIIKTSKLVLMVHSLKKPGVKSIHFISMEFNQSGYYFPLIIFRTMIHVLLDPYLKLLIILKTDSTIYTVMFGLLLSVEYLVEFISVIVYPAFSSYYLFYVTLIVFTGLFFFFFLLIVVKMKRYVNSSMPLTLRPDRTIQKPVASVKEKKKPSRMSTSSGYSKDSEAISSRTDSNTKLKLCGLPVQVTNSSDAAPCTVSGITYLHSQQITREDPCDFCLCLDGEVFCWWQQQCLNTTQQQLPATSQDNSTTSASESEEWVDESSHNTTETPAPQESMCRVMGVEYKIGEVLPRETGTCLQCQCSPGARVTCSPKDCTSPDQFHALEQQSLDMFDVDVF